MFAYLAAIFARAGHEVKYVEDKIEKADIVFLASSMVDYENEINWIKKIKASGSKIGVIGPFAGQKPELYLRYADFVIVGEPESAAIKIASGEIDPKGIIKEKIIDDLDILPFPKWDIFPVSKYSYVPALRQKPFLPILSSRSCPYNCNYCPYLVMYSKYRMRSANNVLEEIKYLHDNFGIKAMLFRDPIFSLNRPRTERIIQGLINMDLGIRWACETRLDHLDEALLDLMYKAGVRVINVGVESSDYDILKKATRKPIEIEHQEKIIKYCEKIGIRVTAFYIFGLPDDTVESIKNTIKYAKKLNTHAAQFFLSTPFPGTQFYQQTEDKIFDHDWKHFDCYTPVMNHKNLSPEELLKLKEKAFVSYYYRPRYAWYFIKRVIRDLIWP